MAAIGLTPLINAASIWKTAYYIYGSFTCFWLIFFGFFFTEKPRITNRYAPIHSHELHHIISNRNGGEERKKEKEEKRVEEKKGMKTPVFASMNDLEPSESITVSNGVLSPPHKPKGDRRGGKDKKKEEVKEVKEGEGDDLEVEEVQIPLDTVTVSDQETVFRSIKDFKEQRERDNQENEKVKEVEEEEVQDISKPRRIEASRIPYLAILTSGPYLGTCAAYFACTPLLFFSLFLHFLCRRLLPPAFSPPPSPTCFPPPPSSPPPPSTMF